VNHLHHYWAQIPKEWTGSICMEPIHLFFFMVLVNKPWFVSRHSFYVWIHLIAQVILLRINLSIFPLLFCFAFFYCCIRSLYWNHFAPFLIVVSGHTFIVWIVSISSVGSRLIVCIGSYFYCMECLHFVCWFAPQLFAPRANDG
jgi:hypothetical protein